MPRWILIVVLVSCGGVFNAAAQSDRPLLPDTTGTRYHWKWAQWGPKGGSYWINNSVWNVGSLVMNKDYAQSINVNADRFPRNTYLTWNYPYPGDGRIYSFPEIVFGQVPGKTDGYMPKQFGLIVPTIKKVREFSKLQVRYDFEVSGMFFTKYNTVAINMWLSGGKQYSYANRKFEIFVGVHLREDCGGGKRVYRLSVPSFTADVWLVPRKPTQICLDPGHRSRSGSIIFADVFADLVKHGVISGDEYIGGVEFGAEPGGGMGMLKINDFSVIWD